MQPQLRAAVIGTGLAGEGHTVALQHDGIEVVATCSRTWGVVSSVTAKLAEKYASTD